MVGLSISPLGLVLLAGVTGGGLLALGFALREGGAIRQVVGGPSTDVFSLSTGTSGPISISGAAIKNEDTLVSPFTGADCLALEYEVEEHRTTQHGTSWVEIDSGRAAVSFLLEEETGGVLVEPTRVRLGLVSMERTTLKNAGIGALVGLVLTFVPLISLLASLVGGGIAGYLERRGAKGGLLPGALAGTFVAAGGIVIRTAFATLRFGIEGAIPIAGVPLPTLLAALFAGTFLMVVAAAGTVPRTRRLVTVLLSLVAGLVTFVAVGLGVTEVLDPYIWPSALVGLPVGAILGVAVAVLGYHVLTTRGRHRGDDGSSGAV